ncbi:hypothetical protein FIBSPDRAFT_858952, partial [Athelia psychrophila]
MRGRVRLVHLVLIDAERLRQEGDEHPRAGREEQEAPSELSDELRREVRPGEVVDGEGAVYEELNGGRGDRLVEDVA